VDLGNVVHQYGDSHIVVEFITVRSAPARPSRFEPFRDDTKWLSPLQVFTFASLINGLRRRNP
jgi:hypothetical protein